MRDTANFEMVSGVFAVVCKKVPKHNNEFTPGKIYKAYAYISNNPGVNWFIFNDLVIPGSIRFGKRGFRTTSNTDCFEISVYNAEMQPQPSPTEQVLSKDWETSEEDKAWKDLQEPKIGDVIGEITYGGRGKPFIPKDEDKQDKLLPCPFCGSKASIDIDNRDGEWTAGCDSCDIYFIDIDKKQAIHSWNTRVQEYSTAAPCKDETQANPLLSDDEWRMLSPESRHRLNIYGQENEKLKRQLEIAKRTLIGVMSQGHDYKDNYHEICFDNCRACEIDRCLKAIAALDEEQA